MKRLLCVIAAAVAATALAGSPPPDKAPPHNVKIENAPILEVAPDRDNPSTGSLLVTWPDPEHSWYIDVDGDTQIVGGPRPFKIGDLAGGKRFSVAYAEGPEETGHNDSDAQNRPIRWCKANSLKLAAK